MREELVVRRRLDPSLGGRSRLDERLRDHPFHDGAPEVGDGSLARVRPQQGIDRGELATHVDRHDPESRTPREA